MKLVERLRQFEGSHGDYEWTIAVWRVDTLAVANLRVRLCIHRVTEHSVLWYRWSSRNEVYTDSELASDATVADCVEELQEKARQVAERFEEEQRAVGEVDV